jgi:hypothetical protein
MLVEAGLDWYPLEARSAHNQRQTKDSPSFSEFYLGEGDQSCTAHQSKKVPLPRSPIDSLKCYSAGEDRGSEPSF